jgi:uncharacterized protein (TIGR00369 family)
MTESNPDYGRAQSEALRDGTELLSWLDIAIENVDDRTATLTLPHSERVVNAGTDFVHGGAVATLVDNAAGTALRTVLSNPEAADYATADLNVSYLRPSTGDLRADAEIRRAGSSLVVIQVEVTTQYEGERKAVALGRVSYFVVNDE